MGTTRDVNMAKLQAGIDDNYLEDEASTSTTPPGEDPTSTLSVEDRVNAEKIKQAELRTQMAINRLEKAKAAATSDAVKAKIQEEIEATKQRKAELAEARKTQLAEAAKTTATARTAADLAGTGAKIGSDIRGNVDATVGKVQDTVGHIAGTLETVSTPGTLWLPITILLVFFFLLLPVNGMTRAQWLWLSLIGDAQIQPSAGTTDTTNTPSGQGGGGSPAPAPTRKVY